MSSKPVRSIITIFMNLLVVVAILLTARVIVVFFGSIASQAWAEALVAITDFITIPWGVEALKTPYGGIFDVNPSLTILVVLLAEWLLSLARNRA